MPAYQLPYLDLQNPPTPAFPAGRTARRPVLVVTLHNGQNQLACYCIVDSGADHCVFPRSFMQPLGLDPLTAPVDATTGVGGTNIPTHYCNVTIALAGIAQFQVYAGFTTGMDQLGIGLLGQTGFFDRFKITFDHASKLFTLETP